ncbi:MAG: hypothetical protein AAGI92_11805 [Pseudomonadota bacterium]
MEIEADNEEYRRELRAVAAAAAELAKYLATANRLPDDFPQDPLNTLCAALIKLPGGTIDGSIDTLIHAHARLPSFRNDYLKLILDEDEAQADFQRGDKLDLQMGGLYLAVGSALEAAKHITGREAEPDLEPESQLPDDLEFGREKLSGKAKNTEAQIDKIRKTLGR